MTAWPLVDVQLSRRLERCEATANAAMITARARVQPETGAEWIDVNGTYALFDGVGSPLTQTFGLGMFATPSDDGFKTLEEFFAKHGSETMHEVSPIAAPETMPMLVARGYQPMELSTVMFQPIVAPPAPEGRVTTRVSDRSERDIELWAKTAADGWRSELGELGDFMHALARVSASSEMLSFFAEIDGQAVGTGALAIHDGVALLAGASTIPSARGQGAQRALLEARLRYAGDHGCVLAMMVTAPGSTSQRNGERRGFRIAYTRIKWRRP